MSTDKDGNAIFAVAIYDPIRNQERVGHGEVFQLKTGMTQGDGIREFRSAKQRLPNLRVILLQEVLS